MKNGDIVIGDRVQTHRTKRRWVGIVIDIEKRKEHAPLLTIKITHDKHGHLQRIQRLTLIDESWVTKLADHQFPM